LLLALTVTVAAQGQGTRALVARAQSICRGEASSQLPIAPLAMVLCQSQPVTTHHARSSHVQRAAEQITGSIVL